jgi:glycine cleavage system H lipoate-binding protein/ABC-type phosphate transport system substrate-binding protein
LNIANLEKKFSSGFLENEKFTLKFNIMKNISVIIIGLSLLFYCTTGLCYGATDDQPGAPATGPAGNSIQVVSSPELTGLATNWADEFARLNPSVKITVGAVTDIQGSNSLSFMTDENPAVVTEQNTWKMVVGRDATVGIINARNPLLEQINRQGISAEKLAQLFSSSDKHNWGSLISGSPDAPFNTYFIENEKVNTAIGIFTGIDNANVTGNKVSTAAELMSAVEKDVNAIGFCKLTDVRDASTNGIIQGLQLLPIDKNMNGRIDSFENIYGSMDAFTRGVWIGKYPSALCGNIYAASAVQPTDKNTVAFLTWIITTGQKYLNDNGYSNLASREVKLNMAVLYGAEIAVAQTSIKSYNVWNWLISLLVIGLVASITMVIVSHIKDQKLAEQNSDFDLTPVLNEDAIMAPKGLYFDKTHTWAFMEEDGNVKVGVDDFLQHITGTITRIAMKKPGESIRKGEKIMTIVRDGKQLELYAPISGVIREQNQSLVSDSSLINTAPFTEGWVYLIEPKNWLREIQFMFMAEKYKEWLGDEFARLKDFFSATVRTNTAVYAHIVLQDGGELTDNVLADLEPEVWEDFQTKFIDVSR